MSSGTLAVIPAPIYSLLEHNEDSSQIIPVFRVLWPHIAQAVASLMITSDLWEVEASSDAYFKTSEDQTESVGSSPDRRRQSGLARVTLQMWLEDKGIQLGNRYLPTFSCR